MRIIRLLPVVICGRSMFYPVQDLLVIGCPPLIVGEGRIGLIEDGSIPFVTAEIRMKFQFLHLGAITGLDYRARRIRLDMQDTVIIASVFHLLVQ